MAPLEPMPIVNTNDDLILTIPQGPPMMRWALLRLLRPKQWVKNGFVLAPLVFAAAFLHAEQVWMAIAAMAYFCVASSATYVLNDMRDVAKDRLHPLKRQTRPLAAGAVSETQAKGMLALLYAILATGFFVLAPAAMLGLLGYMVLNALYSFKLKHMAVVDLFSIASGFVIRVWVGALAIAVPLSSWMAITTLSLALFLAAVKRRQELTTRGAAGRSVLDSYTPALLTHYAQMSAMGAMVFYSLFTMTVRPALAITVPIVLFGLFRYWYLVERFEQGESPTDLVWHDVPLGLTLVAWGGASVYALWP